MSNGIYVGGKVFNISDCDWIEKEGTCTENCLENREGCSFGIVNQSNSFKCKHNLIGHCCKHVIFGNDTEKEKYQAIEKRLDIIPTRIWDKDDQVVRGYSAISRNVCKTATLACLSSWKKKVNILAEGTGDYQGIVNVFGYEDPVGNSSNYGIISSYTMDTDINMYWLIRCLFKKYYENKDEIIGMGVYPIMRDDEKTLEVKSNIFEVDLAIAMGRAFYPTAKEGDNFSLGSIRHFLGQRIGGFKEIMNSLMSFVLLENMESLKAHVTNDSWDAKKSNLKPFLISHEKQFVNYILILYVNMIKPQEFDEKTGWANAERIKQQNLSFREMFIENDLSDEITKEYSDWMELFYINEFVKRQYNVYKGQVIDGLDEIENMLNDIKGQLKEQEEKDDPAFSLLDFTAFRINSMLYYHLIALYVLVLKYIEKEEELPNHLRNKIMKAKECFEKVRAKEDNTVIRWNERFEKVFEFEKRREELFDMCY